MGHPQPHTPIKTNSAPSYSIITRKMFRKRSKAFEMHFHWICFHIKQSLFRLYWQKGTENLADYFTKHFPPKHHRQIRYIYLQRANSQISSQRKTQVRECVPSTASQAIIHSLLTAQARPLCHHVHNCMTRTYRAPFISTYMARAYCAPFISMYGPRS